MLRVICISLAGLRVFVNGSAQAQPSGLPKVPKSRIVKGAPCSPVQGMGRTPVQLNDTRWHFKQNGVYYSQQRLTISKKDWPRLLKTRRYFLPRKMDYASVLLWKRHG